jgi:hypothetical protein
MASACRYTWPGTWHVTSAPDDFANGDVPYRCLGLRFAEEEYLVPRLCCVIMKFLRKEIRDELG